MFSGREQHADRGLLSMKHCSFKPLQLPSIMKQLFSKKGRRGIGFNATSVKRCNENLIPSFNIVMGITEIIKWCITRFSEVNKKQMYGNQNGRFTFWTFNLLKLTSNNWLTQILVQVRPSEVKFRVQLVIFTLDINALSVEIYGILQFFFG